MSLNIVQMRAILRNATGEDEDDISNDDVDLLLNRAFWKIQDIFPFREKEKLATFQTVAGTRNYDVPAGEAIQHLSILDDVNGNGQHVPLTRLDADEYETKYIDTEDEQGVPTHYVREGCMVRFWPTPADTYTIQVRRLIILTDLSNSNATPTIPQVWHEIIAYGGISRRFIELGDINRAAMYKSFQGAEINEISSTKSKEKQANTQHAGVNYIGRTY